ncbi:MAG: hypothetical protein AAFY24_07505 [Pseudomonadota bacterium]
MTGNKIAAAVICAALGAGSLLFLNYLAIIPVMILNYKVFSKIGGDQAGAMYLSTGRLVFFNICIVLTIYALLSGVNQSLLAGYIAVFSDLALLKTPFQRTIADLDTIPLPYIRITLLHLLSLLVFAASLPAMFWQIGNYHEACARIFRKSKKITRSTIANDYLVSGLLIMVFVLLGYFGVGNDVGRHGVGSLIAYVAVIVLPWLLFGIASIWFFARLNSLRLDQETGSTTKNVSQGMVETGPRRS